ncbi:hypothetical protein AGABI2DRAFT_151536 [Agaricus bisporus var. bisporus H97]|uniref:hypothetical protein n=1 Tax=Agaricus bisporus var. bisporus (strain H97 / ATCC MYA-4626 / FGSC 10389) TaxID=936046 RepID=UPI00029F74E3|nr:hypothetical protein AGABI2DRAFT_151536 [Agaricus bisporus var. bisporus H97]EKV46605.1 hypothetical protein AGABI2DRAFT_151536 [Agaricus bisporus var. bisporus H97]
MLRPEWRLWPLASFAGLLDLKTAVTVSLLFALFNKVAGVYGLVAVVTGVGGSFAQLSLYIYSVVALIALVWGLRAVKGEDPKQTLYFAHLFFADHVVSTAWTVFFALAWWIWIPHDGSRQANSPAQQAMIDAANITRLLTDEEREIEAMKIWNAEKSTAFIVITLSWLSKFYFALLIYSYASHLRKGSYRSLPLSRSNYSSLPSNTNASPSYDTALDMGDDEELGGTGDFYHVPLRKPTNTSSTTRGHRRHKSNGSISSFADFVSAPGNRNSRKSKPSNLNTSTTFGKAMDIEEEVLFDEDESTYVSGSSRAHSKMGTEGSSTAASDEERGKFGNDY